VVVPPGHTLAANGRSALRADELAGHPLILMEAGTNLRTYVDGVLSAAGAREQVTLELDNVEAIKRMIEVGLGVSLLPEVSVRAEVTAGRLVALALADVPPASRRMALVVRRDKYLPRPCAPLPPCWKPNCARRRKLNTKIVPSARLKPAQSGKSAVVQCEGLPG
jgi:DNA-binding transcriptional LysR family regulator